MTYLTLVFAEGKVSAHVVHPYVCRVDMKQVGARPFGSAPSEPALRERVLTIIATCCLTAAARALIVAQRIVCDVRITVADCCAVGQHIGRCEGTPDTAQAARAIIHLGEFIAFIFTVNDTSQCCLQRSTALSVGTLVVGAGAIWPLC